MRGTTVGLCGDQSLLERWPIRSKDEGLHSYNNKIIDAQSIQLVWDMDTI